MKKFLFHRNTFKIFFVKKLKEKNIEMYEVVTRKMYIINKNIGSIDQVLD